MQSFRTHAGVAALLLRENIDTDQIIPKQFLKRIERTGYGDFLFYAWRYNAEGHPDPTFILNEPHPEAATILVAGKNFGCGSSREHAVWALRDYGFRAILAPSFADIFATNCVKNGLLPVTLPAAAIAEIASRAPGGFLNLKINLEQCEVSAPDGFAARFEIEPFKKLCLLEGLDEIGMTLKHEREIAAYETRQRACEA